MHLPLFALPTDYSRIKQVGSFEELVGTPFADGINALCWLRELPGDFREIVDKLAVGKGITPVDDARLLSLTLSEAGNKAREVLLQDQQLLRSSDLAPVLECINGYIQEEESGPVPTHVQSFHVDSATVATDTYLCTYYGASSEGLPNEEAQRRVDIPETRAELLRQYGGEDDDEFQEYLSDHYYDLHYLPLPQAQPFSFGLGNLWRIAIDYPGSPVPPCIHRAPATLADGPPRLLLLS